MNRGTDGLGGLVPADRTGLSAHEQVEPAAHRIRQSRDPRGVFFSYRHGTNLFLTENFVDVTSPSF